MKGKIEYTPKEMDIFKKAMQLLETYNTLEMARNETYFEFVKGEEEIELNFFLLRKR